MRGVGVDAVAIDLLGHPFRYRADPGPEPWVVALARWARIGRGRAAGNRVLRAFWAVPAIVSGAALVAWAVWRFDAFVFGFGYSLFGLREVPLLRRLGKRVIFVFHGSDARPPYIDGARMASDRAVPIAACIALAARMKSTIHRIESLADVVVAQPAFSHFFERPVVNFFALGVLTYPPTGLTASGPRGGGPLRILHSPSDPTVKGSARIRETVDKLVAEGLSLELVELRGVPNRVVWEALADADFAVDQLYSDAPMVGFATEAAVTGRATVVGGYAWDENLRILGEAGFPPVETCEPDALEATIRRLATDEHHRQTVAERAKAWAETRWAPHSVALRYLQLIEGEPDPDWVFDPRDLRYVEGCGLSREDARAIVGEVIATGGLAALCLNDKPELEDAFVAFAGDATAGGPSDSA